MRYKAGYKYVVAENATFFTNIKPHSTITIAGFLTLTTCGLLIIRKGYTWDGMTSWFDTRKNIKASLVHDALYQLMRERLLDVSLKKEADILFRDMLIAEEDISAHLCYFAVKTFGDRFIRKPIQILEV